MHLLDYLLEGKWLVLIDCLPKMLPKIDFTLEKLKTLIGAKITSITIWVNNSNKNLRVDSGLPDLMKLVRDTTSNLLVLDRIRDHLLLGITLMKDSNSLPTSHKVLYLSRDIKAQAQNHPGLRLQVTTSSNMISITQTEGKAQQAGEELSESTTQIF